MPSNGSYKAIEPLQSMPLNATLIQAPCKLINVSSEMLFAGFVINAVQSPAHDGENAFDAVSSDAVARVFVLAVIDGFVFVIRRQSFVDGIFVGVQSCASLDILTDCSFNRDSTRALKQRQCTCATAPFTHPNDRSFVGCTGAIKSEPFMHMFALLFATNVNLVYFDGAFEHRGIASAGLAETLQNKPSGLLGYPDLFCQLHRRYPLAGSHKQVHGIEPFVQGNVRSLENCTRPNREFEHASITGIESVLPFCDALCRFALGAHCAVRPKSLFKIRNRARFIGKLLEELEGADCTSAHFVALTEPNTSKSVLGSQVYNSPKKD